MFNRTNFVALLLLACATAATAQTIQWHRVDAHQDSAIGDIVFTRAGSLIVNNAMPEFAIGRSTDLGRTWTRTGSHYGEMLELNNGDIVVHDLGVFNRSTDDGATWGADEPFGTAGFLPITSVAVAPNGDWYIGTQGQDAWRSTNNGRAWSTVIETGEGVIFGFAFGDGAIYMASDSGVYRSFDNGASWNISRSGLESQWVFSVAVDAKGNVYAGTRDRFVAISTDNGATWSFTGTEDQRGGSVNEITALRDGSVVAASLTKGMFRTIDNGASWNRWDNGIDAPFNITMIVEGPDDVLFTAAGARMTRLYSSEEPATVDEQIMADANLTVRPNPARTHLTIASTDGSDVHRVCVYDVIGRLVIDRAVGERSITIDIASYPRGVYTCTIATANSVVTKQLCVE